MSTAASLAVALATLVVAGLLRDDGRGPQTPLPRAQHVVILTIPGLKIDDLTARDAPALHRLWTTQARGAMSVRAHSSHPSEAEAYAALGAGRRVTEDEATAELGRRIRAAGLRTASLDTGFSPVVAATGSDPALLRCCSPRARARVRQTIATHALTVIAGTEAGRREADALVGFVRAAKPPGALLIVTSPTLPQGRALAPLSVSGAGTPPGTLGSPATRQPGLSLLTDLAPTALSALGLPVPDDMIGRPLEVEQPPVRPGRLADLEQETRWQDDVYYPTAVTLIVALLTTLLLVLIATLKDLRVSALRFLVLAVAAAPVSAFAVRAVPGVTTHGALGLLIVPIALTIAALAHVRATDGLHVLERVLAVTAIVLLGDLCTGYHLHASSPFGYSFLSAGRFYGLPNTSFAVVCGSALLLAALWIRRHGPAALPAVAGFCGAAALAIGFPNLGSDVGGILAFVPASIVLLWIGSGRRLNWTIVLAGAALGALLLSAAALFDLSRPPDTRTHLGEFAAQVRDEGLSALTDTVQRKEEANLRFLKSSVWTRALVGELIFLALVLFLHPVRTRLLAVATGPFRTALMLTAAMALIATLLNDSGPILMAVLLSYVTATVSVLLIRPD